MARVSRKNLLAPVQTSPPQRIYQTCLYLRLSKEDSGYENHDSIEMQEYLLEQFIKTQPDMEIVAVFCDNGATGTHFDRPDFERMMDAVRRRDVDCIVVKDLSRFGRNYVETGYYLEKIFPFLGVRFVAVNDSFDTLKSENVDEMVMSLKNIINALFAKDISKKSGSALRRKQENGEFIGSWTPYGYRKSPEDKHLLLIDPETVPIVRDIFTWRLEGLGYGEIAKRLNRKNIPCPTMTRFLRGEFAKKAPMTVSSLWTATTIKNITGNIAYAGHMAQGKRVRSLCDGIPNTEVDRQDWIIVRETHEPIVTEEIWNAVSAINQQAYNKATQKRKLPKTDNILVGLVFCKDCGKTMARLKNCSRKGHIRYTYNCRIRKASKGESGCTNKSIGEEELLDILLQSIHVQIAAAVEQEKLLKKVQSQPSYRSEQKKLACEIKDVRAQISKNTVRRSILFESHSDRLVTDEEYQVLKEAYDIKVKELAAQEQSLLSQQFLYQKTLSTGNKWLKAFHKYKDTPHLTREMAVDLIHHITIEGRCDVHIFWNFSDEYDALLRLTKEDCI